MPAPTSEDDLKRRARRRLIGAVALTLVAVIVLPLMLEDEPPPAAQLQVHMPANTKTPDFVPFVPAPVPEATIAPVTQTPAPASAPESEAVVAEAPIEKPKPVAVAEQKPKPVVATEVKQPPEPNPPSKTESKPAAEKNAGFVVQLGAFADAAKTAVLQQQVDDLGMSSYIDKSGALTRLRVGPFASREAAAQAAAKLSASGVHGQVMPK